MINNNNAVATLFLGVILGLTVYGTAYETLSPLGGGVSGQPTRNASTAAANGAVYHRLPLYFEANRGQAPAPVRFLSHGPDYGLYLTPSGPVLALRRGDAAPALVRVRLLGANADMRISGRHRQHGTVNYIKGNDPRHWRQGIPVYAQVAYTSVYPGVDMVYHGHADQLEYDFTVAPNADPGAIRMAFSGVDDMRLDGAGRLHLVTGRGEVIQQAPVAYQMIGGVRRPVSTRYVIRDARQVGFAVSGYDTHRPLIIDPVLSFSTYFGGGGDDRGWAIARDASDGSIYVTGRTASVDFPATVGDTNCGSTIDCTQNQISDTFTGTTLDAGLWTASGNVTQNDSLTITTAASPSNRASVTTTGALQSNFDAHVSLSGLNEAGKLTGISVQIGSSTYDFEVSSSTTNQDYVFSDGSGCTGTTAIATSAANFEDTAELRVVRTGSTLSFMAYSPANPILKTYVLVGTCSGVSTADASLQLFTETADGTAKTSVFDDFYASESNGSPDAFVMRLDNGGTTLSYATYLGGSNEDEGLAVAAAGGAAYVTGRTLSTDFPVTAGAYDTQCPDTDGDSQCDNGADAFVAKLDSAGTVAYATYLGGCFDDAANAIAVDASGNAYVGGYTNSAPDTATSSTTATCVDEFPLVNAIQTTNKGRKDAFVTKINPTGSALVYSTFLGGAYADEVLGIAVSSGGEAYVTGYTASSDFPVVPVSGAFQPTLGNNAPGATAGYDAFVSVINAAGNALVYSTYLGGSAYDYGQGIAVDASGAAYVAGWTRSTDFPTASPVQAAGGGSYDAFVAKLNPAGAGAGDLVYSTYLGGTDTEEALGIAVDAGGDAVITGYSTSRDFLIALLRDVRPDLVTPLTTLNNLDNYVMNNMSTDDLAQALVQLDPSLNLAAMQALSRSDLIGRIFSEVDGDLVSELGAIQTDLAGSSDAMVVKLNAGGSAITEATFLGGGDEDYATGITLDASGNPFITGYTVTNPPNSVSGLSEAQNFPVTANADTSLKSYGGGKEEDAFIAKIDDGSVDLQVTLAAAPSGAVDPGSNVTYTATVSNLGASTAEGVVLTDTLQIGLNLVSAGAQQGGCTPSAADITAFTNTITCPLGAIAAGATTTVTIVAAADPAETTLTDQASVTALATDSDSANNSAVVSTSVNVNVPLQASRTCDFNATKPTGCSVPALGAFDPDTLAALALSLAAAGGLRRRRVTRSSGYQL